MMCSKLSASSFFSVDHILIISGRVPKIETTFISGSEGRTRDRSEDVLGCGVERHANIGQRHQEAAALTQIVAAFRGNLVEERPRENQKIIRRLFVDELVVEDQQVNSRRVHTVIRTS